MDKNFINLSKFTVCYGILYFFYESVKELEEHRPLLNSIINVMDMYNLNPKQKVNDKILKVNDYLHDLNKDVMVSPEVLIAMLNGIIENELLYVKYLPKKKALLELQEKIIKHTDYHIDNYVFDKADELNRYLENQIKNYRG